MKITDSQVIREGEKELINAVKDEIDPEKIRDLISHKLSDGNLKARDGQIVIHNNQIAFRLDFELQFTGSILLDREGNLLSDGIEDDHIENQSDEDAQEENVFDEDFLDEEPEPESELDPGEDQEELDELVDDEFNANHDLSVDDAEEHDGESGDYEDMEESEEILLEDELPEYTEEDENQDDELSPLELDEEQGDLDEELEQEELVEHEGEEAGKDDAEIDEILFDDSEITGEDADLSEEVRDDEGDQIESNQKEDILDDDINEILQETRSYWKQNKKEE